MLKGKGENYTGLSYVANPHLAQLESCGTVRIETDSCTNFVFIV